MIIPEYSRYDGLGLAELVRRREVSPVDLVDSALDAIERLMQRGLTAENLKQLRIYMSRKAISNVGWKYVPAGVVAAQMNAFYTSAMKILEGDVFIDQFKEHKLAEPKVLSMIDRIRINHEPAFDAGGASTRHKVRVEIGRAHV